MKCIVAPLALLGLTLPLLATPPQSRDSLPACVPGWRLEVVATAPRIRHPSVVCCAPDGRIFVAEDPMDISTPTADVAQGRLLCLHPDGRTTVFADRLHAVFGLQYIDGHIYVLHNPKFSRFRDGGDTGQDRLDLIEHTHPKPWDLNWNDHVPANFRLAMDGYLYIAVGDKGLFGAVGRDGRRLDMRGGGVVRMRPEGTELEIYSTGVRNILDVAMDAEGEIFTYDNTDEHEWMGRLTHMIDGGFYGYPHDFVPRRPYTLWMMADLGGGAATGALAYNEDGLPAAFQSNLFLADFGKRQVIRIVLAREGATFRVVKREDLIVDPPGDLRPVGICLAPDGRSLYVCDWQHTDTKDSVVCGRLLRLVHTGPNTGQPARPSWYLPAALGKPINPSTEDLIRGLSHPSEAVRLVAQRRLVERKETVALRALLSNPNASVQGRIHALWALDAVDGGLTARSDVRRLAVEATPSLRRQALRQLGQRRLREAGPELTAGLRDKDPTIRLQSATSLGRTGDPLAVPALQHALEESDLFVRYAVFYALRRIGHNAPHAWSEIIAGLGSDRVPIRTGSALAIRDIYDPVLTNGLAGWAEDTKQPAGARAEALTLLAQVHKQRPPWKGEWWAYHPALKPPPPRTVAWAGTESIGQALRRGVADRSAEVRQSAVAGLRHCGDTVSAKLLREAYLRETQTTVRREILRTLGVFRDAEAAPLVVAALKDPDLCVDALDASSEVGGVVVREGVLEFLRRGPSEKQQRALAARAVGRLQAAGGKGLLVALVADPHSEVRDAALTALGELGSKEALDALARLTTNSIQEIRISAIRALGEVGSNESRLPLLAAVRVSATRAAALTALVQRSDLAALDAYLEGLTETDADLREKCREAIRSLRGPARPELEKRAARLPVEVVARLQDLYRDDAEARKGPLFAIKVKPFDPTVYLAHIRTHVGNSDRGRARFFEKTGLACARCHKVNGEGDEIGPDLSSIGEQFDRVQLAEHVLYPSQSIREGYRPVTVQTTSGRTHTGLVVSESTEALVLRDSEGKIRTIPASQIMERRTGDRSLMPEGLVEGLPLEAFADLISYLQTLRKRKGS